MKQLIFAFIAVTILGLRALATPMLYDWEDGDVNVFSDWTVGERYGGTETGTLTGDQGAGTTVDSNNNALRIEASTPTSDPTLRTDIIYTGAFAGNMNAYGANSTDIAGVRFDFYNAAGEEPVALGFYFQNSDNGNVWFYNVVPSTAGGWTTYSTAFDYDYGYGWMGYDTLDFGAGVLDDAAFLADIGSVNNLGLFITYQTEDQSQVYGIDDFGLTVPEPETYMVLGMALLTMAFVFRKRITESLAEARTMMQV